MSPGVLTLPDNTTTFPSIGEFPRFDCAEWATTEAVTPNLSNIIPTNFTDGRTDKYASIPIYAAPDDAVIGGMDTFNCLIVNPAKTYDNQFKQSSSTSNQIKLYDDRLEIVSDDINKSNYEVSGDWWVFNGTSSSKIASIVNLSKLQIDSGYTGISGNPLKINTKNKGILKFTGNTSKATAAGTSGITMIPSNTLTFNNCSSVVDINGGSASGNTTFSGCTKVENVDLGNASGTLTFNDCEINKLTMGADTGSVTFSGCTFSGNTSGTTFGCFKGASTAASTITSCVFADGCNLSNSNLQECEFENVNFSENGAVLKNAKKTAIANQTITKDFNMDLRHDIEIDNCAFGEFGSLMKSDLAAFTGKYSKIALINSTINNNMIFNTIGDTTNASHGFILQISNSTFNNPITFGNITADITSNTTIPIDNVTISMPGTISNLASNGSMKYLNIYPGHIEATQPNDDTNAYPQVFTVTPNNSGGEINLNVSTKKDAEINYTNGFTMTGNPTISAPISTNLRGQLILGEDLTFSVGSNIGDGESNLVEVTDGSLKLYQDKKYTIQSGSFSNVDLQEDYVLNQDLMETTVYKEDDLTILRSDITNDTQQPQVQYAQDNIIIGSLTYAKGSILKYDSTDFLTSSMDISGLEIIISNNSLKNNSTSDFTLPASFNIGDTIINNPSNYKLAAGKTLFVIGQGTYILTSDIETDTTILNGNLLATDSDGFLIVPKDKYEGITIGNLVIDGTLDLSPSDISAENVKLNVVNPMTIPKGTTVTVTSSQITLNSLPTFIGTNTITLTGSSYSFGTSTFDNSSGSFSGFDNTGTFKMIYSNVASDKSIEIVNKGITEWYSATINPIDNGKLTINNGSMICPTTDIIGDILTFNGSEFEVGYLNIAPKGKLFIQCQATVKTIFKGSLQVNSVAYLGTVSQTVPPIASNSDSTTLIINTSKYDSLHPFTGQLEMSAQGTNEALLQINSSGAIRIKPSSKFVVSGYSENQKVIINGTFESIVEEAVYEYQKDLTLNGTIELERSAIIKGDLQITSSGRLFIGANAGTVEGSEEVTASISSDTTEGTSTTYTISISETSYESASITIDTSSSAVTLEKPTDPSKIQPVEFSKVSDTKYNILYVDGLIVILDVSTAGTPTVSLSNINSPDTSPNTFFGPSSKVYISNSLEIFGEFYNNGSIDINARLLCTASSSVTNDGKIQVRGGNNNVIMGNIKIGNAGSLVFNGTYNDHSGHSLLINERGILTVNDSLMISTGTEQMIISPNSNPQICNVLINGDINTSATRYKISPSIDNTRAQVYLPINSQDNLAQYVF